MASRYGGMLAVAVAALALGAFYGLFRQQATRTVESVAQATERPAPTPDVASSARSATIARASATAVPDAPPPAGIFRLAIADLKPGVEMPVLRARQGDPITLVITSSRSGTLEVHGYDQRIAIGPGSDATLSFKADRTGRFPIHLHDQDGKHLEVTALEIVPR